MTAQQPVCEREEYRALFQRIDRMVKKVDESRLDPRFQIEKDDRTKRSPNYEWADKQGLKSFIELIAYSQGANSRAVKRLVDSGDLEKVFEGYDLQSVASLTKDKIVRQYWPEKGRPRKPIEIGAIRYHKKIDSMIGCAVALLVFQKKVTSFMAYLKGIQIPKEINTERDLDVFWTKFDQVRQDLMKAKMPFFRSFTTLCHLFTHLGYDCAKPDSAVMAAMLNLSVVTSPGNGESELKRAVKTMQIYGMCRRLRTPVVDFYFLIHGGQEWAKQFVRTDYYDQQP